LLAILHRVLSVRSGFTELQHGFMEMLHQAKDPRKNCNRIASMHHQHTLKCQQDLSQGTLFASCSDEKKRAKIGFGREAIIEWK
jgi:hypothetical protein